MAYGSLLLLGGPNGAGKSTLANSLVLRNLLNEYRKVNADERTLELIKEAGYSGFHDVPDAELKRYFIQAANETYQLAVDELRSGANICLETVLSTDKYCSLVSEVRNSGGKFGLLYVALNSPSLSMQRVAARVAKGGHAVPPDRLVERWRRSLEFLPWFVRQADFFMIFDNSLSEPAAPPQMVAVGNHAAINWDLEPSSVFPELRQTLCSVFPLESSPATPDPSSP